MSTGGCHDPSCGGELKIIQLPAFKRRKRLDDSDPMLFMRPGILGCGDWLRLRFAGTAKTTPGPGLTRGRPPRQPRPGAAAGALQVAPGFKDRIKRSPVSCRGGHEHASRAFEFTILIDSGNASEADWMRYLDARTSVTHHPDDSCRMGRDDHAAVDAALRVRGTDALRKEHISIMPAPVHGNAQAAAFAIGANAAPLILAEAAWKAAGRMGQFA